MLSPPGDSTHKKDTGTGRIPCQCFRKGEPCVGTMIRFGWGAGRVAPPKGVQPEHLKRPPGIKVLERRQTARPTAGG